MTVRQYADYFRFALRDKIINAATIDLAVWNLANRFYLNLCREAAKSNIVIGNVVHKKRLFALFDKYHAMWTQLADMVNPSIFPFYVMEGGFEVFLKATMMQMYKKGLMGAKVIVDEWVPSSTGTLLVARVARRKVVS